VLSENETGDGLDRGIQYQIRKGLFYQACEKAAQIAGYSTLEEALAVSKEERKITFTNAIAQNKIYAIFLDEINRTNVSAVFGELITLIEDDKRLGGDNEIADTILPYSQTAFGIPTNLYLIGTMNTADRSVEALDTALRRRFVFEQMMPLPKLLSPKAMIVRMLNTPESKECDWEEEPYRKIADGLFELVGTNKSIEEKLNDYIDDDEAEWQIKHLDHISDEDFTGINLENLLTAINSRIQKLTDADHQIGHAFFMNVFSKDQLYNLFYHKIIPQLQEYFYGDFGKIGLVLGSGFISYAQTEQKFSFANFQYEDKDELAEKRVYTIERFHNENGERDFDAFENAVKNVYL
jgi:5-methylcytosine-specific restriction enzyme B